MVYYDYSLNLVALLDSVPVKEWKTANGNNFASELKEAMPIEQMKDKLSPSLEHFKTIEAKLPNITCY